MNNTDLSFIHRFVPGHGHYADETLLLLHGTGGNEDDLLGLGAGLLPGAALLSPRGKILENGMPRFFRRHAEGIFDLEDLRFRAEELAGFIEAACREYEIDRSGLTAVGYSNGANIAAGILLLHPQVFFSAVLFRAMPPFEPEPPPDLKKHKILLTNGLRDPIIAADSGRKLTALFEDCGAEVATYLHPGGHELGEGDISSAMKWLEGQAGRRRFG